MFGFVSSFGNLEMSLFPRRPGAHHLADRDPAIPRMEDRSDNRCGIRAANPIDATAMLITDRFVKISRVV